MVTHPPAFDNDTGQTKAWLGMIVLSVLFHGLFFSGVLFFPELDFRKDDLSTLVEIDLVSLPAAPAPARQIQTPTAARPVPVKKKSSTQKISDTAPSAKEAVPVSPPKPIRVKRSLKKKTFNASKAINQAIAKLEKSAPESRPQSVLKAIDALKKKEQTEGAPAAVGTGMGENTKKHLELLDIYHAEIWNKIKSNWAYTEELDRDNRSPRAIIIVKIMRDGEIRDLWFEERSGGRYFDESCLKAIKKSNPLPPLPQGILKPYHEVGFRFDPRDLQRRP